MQIMKRYEMFQNILSYFGGSQGISLCTVCSEDIIRKYQPMVFTIQMRWNIPKTICRSTRISDLISILGKICQNFGESQAILFWSEWLRHKTHQSLLPAGCFPLFLILVPSDSLPSVALHLNLRFACRPG